ncbi:MAG: mechanosensitive ion channel [Gloeotrichia echinulata DVL01]|jgi:hypothetical protein|nr:mechanosensitive ion channel [Gloeotrichia echinulata DEX184]
MNTTWPGITQVMEVGLSMKVQQLLAQSPSLPTNQPEAQQGIGGPQEILNHLWDSTPLLLEAVAILFIGLVIAAVVAAVIRGIVNRTDIDNRIASGLTGRDNLPQVEQLISGLVFWSIVLLTVVAVLDKLNLRVASQPLNNFLNPIVGYLPNLLGAGILLGVAWLLATLVRLVTVRALQALRLDERLNEQTQDGRPTPNQLSISETIGTALYWFIFLLFLVPVLTSLGLTQALQPVQALITEIISILPKILGATGIAVVGWFVANIVRRIVSNLLATTGIDHLGSRFGLSPSTGAQSLSSIIGLIVYILILIPVGISALNTLEIKAISDPAIAALQEILKALPGVFTAVGILIFAYFLGQFVSDLVTSILTSIGFNNIFQILGLPVPSRETAFSEEEGTTAPAPTRTPSEIVGIIVLVGILLFATVAAVNILNIPALTVLVTGILIIIGRILAGLVIFAIGLFLANLAFNIITSSGDSQARVLGQVARISIITLVSAMALQQIGVAPDIVNLAFGLLLGAIAVAIALAFGLGGRDIAREQVQNWLESFKSKN